VFFQFSTDYIEIFSKCFFFQSRLNDAIKYEITLLHSEHFTLQSAHFALFFQQLGKITIKKVRKTVQNVRFVPQNVHCAVLLGQI
jgi:hypothetical protein